MVSNFEFLDIYWNQLYKLGEKAEEQLYKDNSACVITLGLFAEKLTEEIINSEHLQHFDEISQFERIEKLNRIGVISDPIKDKLHKIRMTRNDASHKNLYITAEDAEQNLRYAYDIGLWFVRRYSDKQVEIPYFSLSILRNNGRNNKAAKKSESDVYASCEKIVKKVYNWKLIMVLIILLIISVGANIYFILN